jgi:hypothetical protein
VVTSILCSRKPSMPARVSERVLRHERVGSVCLTPWGGMAMGASEEHRDAYVGRWKAVALPASAAWDCLMPA